MDFSSFLKVFQLKSNHSDENTEKDDSVLIKQNWSKML